MLEFQTAFKHTIEAVTIDEDFDFTPPSNVSVMLDPTNEDNYNEPRFICVYKNGSFGFEGYIDSFGEAIYSSDMLMNSTSDPLVIINYFCKIIDSSTSQMTVTLNDVVVNKHDTLVEILDTGNRMLVDRNEETDVISTINKLHALSRHVNDIHFVSTLYNLVNEHPNMVVSVDSYQRGNLKWEATIDLLESTYLPNTLSNLTNTLNLFVDVSDDYSTVKIKRDDGCIIVKNALFANDRFYMSILDLPDEDRLRHSDSVNECSNTEESPTKFDVSSIVDSLNLTDGKCKVTMGRFDTIASESKEKGYVFDNDFSFAYPEITNPLNNGLGGSTSEQNTVVDRNSLLDRLLNSKDIVSSETKKVLAIHPNKEVYTDSDIDILMELVSMSTVIEYYYGILIKLDDVILDVVSGGFLLDPDNPKFRMSEGADVFRDVVETYLENNTIPTKVKVEGFTISYTARISHVLDNAIEFLANKFYDGIYFMANDDLIVYKNGMSLVIDDYDHKFFNVLESRKVNNSHVQKDEIAIAKDTNDHIGSHDDSVGVEYPDMLVGSLDYTVVEDCVKYTYALDRCLDPELSNILKVIDGCDWSKTDYGYVGTISLTGDEITLITNKLINGKSNKRKLRENVRKIVKSYMTDLGTNEVRYQTLLKKFVKGDVIDVKEDDLKNAVLSIFLSSIARDFNWHTLSGTLIGTGIKTGRSVQIHYFTGNLGSHPNWQTVVEYLLKL